MTHRQFIESEVLALEAKARIERERAEFMQTLDSVHDAIARDVASVGEFARALFAPFMSRK